MLKQVQAGTGVLFAVFVAVHLINLWLASLGSSAYDGFQEMVRPAYQWPPVEILLLAALAVHVVVGLMRIFSEPKRTLTPRGRWHRRAGIFMLIVIIGHIFAVRGPSWFFDLYPQFAGLAFSIDFAPYYFYPYYFLLGLGGFYHMLNGLSIALPRLGGSMPLSTQVLRRVTWGAGGLTVAALLGFGGLWTDVGDPYQSEFARLALELLE